jgi:hypothetical protein
MTTGIPVISSTDDKKQSWLSKVGVLAFSSNDVAANRKNVFKTKCGVTAWKSSKV